MDPVSVAVVVTRCIAGAGGVALRGALALDPARFRVTLMSADGGPLLGQAEQAGLEVVRLRHLRPELSPVADARALGELVGTLGGGRYHLVHTHSAKAGGLGRVAAHRVGVPAIVHTFHGFPFHDFQSRVRRRGYLEVERRLARITDQFLAVGGAVAAQAVQLGITPPERVRAIAAAITPDIALASGTTRAHARRLLGLPDDALVVGTVGRLDHQKAPGDFVAAMAALPHPNLIAVWVGDGPLRESVQRQIAGSGLAGRLLLAGERNDVGTLLPAFDVFAMSSRYEGLPCAVVEAMTCGIPVVATAVNAVPDVVVPGRTGLLVRAGDPSSLARAIAYLLDHPEQGARMATTARAGLGGRFHSEALGADLTETYDLALGNLLQINSATRRSA
jgi:glycosyltransferase involved in cell wall biosynthesis